MAMLAASAGCQKNAASLEDSARLTRIQQLEDRIEQQSRLLAGKDDQLRAQAEMIRRLRGLGKNRKIDDLIHVERIEIERLSGGYDDDHNGIDDGVTLYLRLYDQYGETMRATGSLTVRLFDLAASPDRRNLGWVELSPKKLNALWFGRFLTSHYTIKVPWAEGVKPPAHGRVTVVASFTDLLSGRSFDAQRVVDVHIAPAADGPKGLK